VTFYREAMTGFNSACRLNKMFTPLNFYPVEFRLANLPMAGFNRGVAENRPADLTGAHPLNFER